MSWSRSSLLVYVSACAKWKASRLFGMARLIEVWERMPNRFLKDTSMQEGELCHLEDWTHSRAIWGVICITGHGTHTCIYASINLGSPYRPRRELLLRSFSNRFERDVLFLFIVFFSGYWLNVCLAEFSGESVVDWRSLGWRKLYLRRQWLRRDLVNNCGIGKGLIIRKLFAHEELVLEDLAI